MKTPVKLTLLDRVVGYVSPQSLIQRTKAKSKLAHAQQLGYITPGSPKKTMKGVVATPNSPAADIGQKLPGTRAIARDLVMNNTTATSVFSRMSTNIVGGGLLPQIMPDFTMLGISPEEAAKWADNVEKRFAVWAGSKESDFYGLYDFYDQQALALVSTLLNGDTFYTLPWRPSQAKNWPWELQLQLIEADLVRDPDHKEYAMDCVNGVEFKKGRVAAYHVANHYPNQGYLENTSLKRTFHRVPVYDAQGRRNIYHLLPAGHRIGQRRGVGILAPLVDMLKTLTRYTEAFLVGELVASLFTVFVKDMSATGGYLNEGFIPEDTVAGGGTLVGEEGAQFGLSKDADSALDVEMGAGNIIYLDDDKEIQLAEKKRDTQGFAPFFHALLKQIAAAVEIPQEQLLLEFNTSYSSARAALLEAWKMYKKRRTWLARNFCQPVLEAFLEEEVARGHITAKGFLEDPVMRAAWSTCIWIGPGQGQIDPLKETKSAVMAIQNNLATHEEEYAAAKGGRWDAAMQRKKQEIEKLKELGLYTGDRTDNTEEATGPTGTDPVEPGTENSTAGAVKNG